MSGTSAKRLLRMAALCAALLSMFASSGDHARFNNLGHQIICMCGGCNQLLLECNHVGCSYSERMRTELTSSIARGDSDNQVRQWFVQEYGLTVLAAPLNRGFGRVAWTTPFAVFLAALVAAALVIRNWKLRPATVSGPRDTTASRELMEYREQARRETEL